MDGTNGHATNWNPSANGTIRALSWAGDHRTSDHQWDTTTPTSRIASELQLRTHVWRFPHPLTPSPTPGRGGIAS
jgi:hypothetical protein